MASCSSIATWKIPWTVEHGRLQSIVSEYATHTRMRESLPRQVDKKSRGPQGERSGLLKEEERTNFLLFFPSIFLRIV